MFVGAENRRREVLDEFESRSGESVELDEDFVFDLGNRFFEPRGFGALRGKSGLQFPPLILEALEYFEQFHLALFECGLFFS